MTEARLGGCGPVIVRAGPHLGGGPDFMAGSDPAGRPLRARLGHRQRPQGPSHFWTAANSRRSAATPGAPKRVSAAEPRPPGNPGWRRGVERCMVVDWRKRLARPSTTKQGGDWFRLRWLILEKRAEGGGRNLVKMRPQNTSANSNSTVTAQRATLALAA